MKNYMEFNNKFYNFYIYKQTNIYIDINDILFKECIKKNKLKNKIKNSKNILKLKQYRNDIDILTKFLNKIDDIFNMRCDYNFEIFDISILDEIKSSIDLIFI